MKVSWLFLDLNSYFASVEQQENPKLRSQPVGVVPLMADSTCLIAASYEAKAFGLKTGTLVGEAKRLCPEIKLIEANHQRYIEYHHAIVSAIDKCIPIEKICSIDEVACRLMGTQQQVDKAQRLAKEIKQRIAKEVGPYLKCSIGLAPNRFLAKVASDMQKPDGLVTLCKEELPQALLKLELRDMPGIGPRMEKRLKTWGIDSMARLCALPVKEMRALWGGVVGERFWGWLRGEDIEIAENDKQSIGHSHVLPPELRNSTGALGVLQRLTNKATVRLRREGYYATHFSVSVRFMTAKPAPRQYWERDAKIFETQDAAPLLHLLREWWQELPAGKIMKVGLTFTGLVPEALHSPSLFERHGREKLLKAMDKLNLKYGKHVLYWGAIQDYRQNAPLRIAFTRIPETTEI